MSRTTDSLRTHVYKLTKQDILMGVYGLGEQLSVEQLAERYKVSKTPVSNALHMLQVEGLVEIVPRIGYFTARFTTKNVQDMFEIRLILETASARLAAKRITDYELLFLERLRSFYTPGDQSTYTSWLQYNREFHCGIAASSRNADLTQMIGHLLDRMQRALWVRLDLPLYPDGDGQGHGKPQDILQRDALPPEEQSMEQHISILEALRRSDGEAAAEAIAGDITASRDAALKKMLENPKLWPV